MTNREKRQTAVFATSMILILAILAIPDPPAAPGAEKQVLITPGVEEIREVESTATTVFPTITTPDEPTSVPAPYTDREVEILAKMLYGEARGVKSYIQKAACVWVVLNRRDAWGRSIEQIVTAPHQFVGYRPENPVVPELEEIVVDVLDRYWTMGQRDIPEDYLYFTGNGAVNVFRTADGRIWNFEEGVNE